MTGARATGTERSRRAVLGGIAGFAMAAAMFPAPAFAQFEPGLPAAIQAAARGDREVAAFYQGRRYRPLWIKGGEIGPEADQILHLLETADADGLNPRTYRVPALIEAIRESGDSARALARAEVLLSRTFAAYVQDVRRARDMGVVYAEAHFRPIVPTRTVILESAAAAPDLSLHLASIGWMNPMYAQLRGALAAQGSDDERPRVHIPAGPILRPGSTDPRVRLLRARLGLVPEGRYDNAVVNAVRSLQRAHSMPVDGVAGPLTVALLNQGSPQQRQLLRLNLERARALPAQLGERYVLVDAAAARLWMYEDGEVRDSMRVVVGKPSEPTPMMAAMLRSVTLNPYWNIPPDLVRSRVAPGAAREGAAFLRARRYEILSDWTDNAEVISPAAVNWAAVASGREELRVRQLPGRDNAMGRMKFNFPNEHGIYLHDTPDRNLLREEGRLFSSGCVRVEDAARLARWLFGRVPTARGSEPEQQIALPEPVPVYITYLTVAPEPQGVATRPDVYNRDPAQLAALDRRPGRRSR